MKNSIPKIRVLGQRSIASSFLNRTSNPSEENPKKKKKKVENCPSFSEFLDGKLNKSVLFKPNHKEDGSLSRPFASFASSKDPSQHSNGFTVERNAREEKRNNGDGGLEKTMLHQFKPRETDISEEVSRDIADERSLEALIQAASEDFDELNPNSIENNEDIIVVDEKTAKKRKDPFEGMERVNRTGKPVIVFGGNSQESTQTKRKRGSNDISKTQRPTYNHYANGSGWWDCDMEGVDSEEVGHSEVWEGVGSTTYGDIVDWH
ncbi:unnamed protein product [Cochlearia groenlandica]